MIYIIKSTGSHYIDKNNNIIIHTLVHALHSIDSREYVPSKLGRNYDSPFIANSGEYTETHIRKRNQIYLSSINDKERIYHCLLLLSLSYHNELS